MTDIRNRDSEGFIRHPGKFDLLKVSGKIANLVVSRDEAIFVFTKADKNSMGVIAISAALAGLHGQAAAISSNSHSMEESADYIEFDIGEKKLKGWVWRNPFSNGDDIDDVAELVGEHYILYGISRPRDKMIALYPHCSRAKNKHIKNAFKWWCIALLFTYTSLFFMDNFTRIGRANNMEYWSDFFLQQSGWAWIVALLITWAIPVASMTMQWMPFVRVAEKVFRALELPNPESIDLVKSSSKQRTPEDKAEFGSMYFKY